MKLTRSTCILAASMMLFCIMIAGCIGTDDHNQTIPLTPVSGYNQIPASTLTRTPTSGLTQTVSNKTFWIRLDPVGNPSAGDRIYINGTTNLDIGEPVLIMVHPADWDPKSRTQCEECSAPYANSVTVFVGEGPQKNTSFFNGVIDSQHSMCKGIPLIPQEYTAIARVVMHNADDQVNFTLMPSNLSANVTYGARGCG